MIYNKIIIAQHDHQLNLLHDNTNSYTCDGCKEVGLGSHYECCDCDYHLHSDCALAFIDKQAIPTPFHPELDHCLFLQQSQPNCRCDACGRDVQGFVYRHFTQGWNFHPTCANLKHKYITCYQGKNMVFTLKEKASSKCCCCDTEEELEKNVNGWKYVSEKYHIHVHCMKMMMINASKTNMDRNKLDSDECNGETSKAMVAVPMLQIITDQSKKSKGKLLRKMKKIVTVPVQMVLAAKVMEAPAEN